MPFDLSKLSQLTQNYGTGAIQENSASLGYTEVETDKLSVDPLQPRKNFSEEGLKELAQSIKQYGLLQPILVRKKEEGFLIVAGERRFRAAKLAGQAKVKIVVLDDAYPEAEIGYIQMAENMKRSDLSVDEIAEFICGRIADGEKQVDIAEKLDLTKALVSKYSAWTNFPEEIKEALRNKKINSIQTAHTLYKKWEEYPEKVLSLLAGKERITQSEAARFSPESCLKATFSDEFSEDSVDQEQTVKTKDEQIEFSAEEKSTEQGISDDEMFSVPRGAEFSDNDSDGTEDKDAVVSNQEDFPSNENSESEVSSGCFETNIGGEQFKGSQRDESFGEAEKSEPDFLEEKTSDAQDEMFKHPVIFCFVEGRECQLLYRKKTPDGLVCVKYEDGSESEITAEKVLLNRICEA